MNELQETMASVHEDVEGIASSLDLMRDEAFTQYMGDILTECQVVPRNRYLPITNAIYYNEVIRNRNPHIPLRGEIPIRNFRLSRNSNHRARRKHSIHQPGRTNCTQRYQLKM